MLSVKGSSDDKILVQELTEKVGITQLQSKGVLTVVPVFKEYLTFWSNCGARGRAGRGMITTNVGFKEVPTLLPAEALGAILFIGQYSSNHHILI